MASASGNQIFVTLRKGSNYPPTVVEARIKYEQTIGDLRKAVAKKAGIEVEKLQIFWHSREIRPEDFDQRTLLEMDLHTGFSLMAYDLTETPVYWPPVKKSAEGWLEVVPAAQALLTSFPCTN